MHKEAMREVIPITLSPEAKSLINWVTDALLPKMVTSKDNALRDLDLSSIIHFDSPMSSPVYEDPPNRLSSPILGDLANTSFHSHNDVFEEDAHILRAAIATAISTLYPLAEWLSFQFSRDAVVSGQVVKMCQFLERSNKVVRKALLPLLFHIAITSLKNMTDSHLLKELLLSMRNVEPSQKEGDIISYAMAMVVSLNDKRTLMVAISSVVDVIEIIALDIEGEESKIDVSFLEKIGSCMKTVIEAVLSEKQSSLLLAQNLTHSAKASSVRECMFKELGLQSPKTDELNEILSKWAAENTTRDAPPENTLPTYSE